MASSSISDAFSGVAIGISAYGSIKASEAESNSEKALRAVCKNNYNKADCAEVCLETHTIGRKELPGWRVEKTYRKENICTTESYKPYTETGINGIYISYIILGVLAILLVLSLVKKSDK